MLPRLSHDYRENMTHIWHMVMSATAFAGAKAPIQKAIGTDWLDLTRRIPESA